MLYGFWGEIDTPYSDYFYSWSEWLFQYYNELPLYEDIESTYLMWKSEQYRIIPKYYILSSLLPLVKHYFVTLEDDDNKFKINCQHSNGFVTCSVSFG